MAGKNKLSNKKNAYNHQIFQTRFLWFEFAICAYIFEYIFAYFMNIWIYMHKYSNLIWMESNLWITSFCSLGSIITMIIYLKLLTWLVLIFNNKSMCMSSHTKSNEWETSLTRLFAMTESCVWTIWLHISKIHSALGWMSRFLRTYFANRPLKWLKKAWSDLSVFSRGYWAAT